MDLLIANDEEYIPESMTSCNGGERSKSIYVHHKPSRRRAMKRQVEEEEEEDSGVVRDNDLISPPTVSGAAGSVDASAEVGAGAAVTNWLYSVTLLHHTNPWWTCICCYTKSC
jgi:hypothetical protein